MVRKRALRNGCILVDADGCLRPAILDDGVLQFRHSVSAFGDSPTADDRRDSHCIVHDHRGHVAGAIPDHCALVGQQESAVQLGLLSSTAGRDHDHDCDVCRDGASVHAVFKGRTANLDLGTKSRRASAARPQASDGGGSRRSLGDPVVRALYALYSDPDTAQRAVDSLRRAGVADRQITVISSEPFEEYEFSHRDKPTWIFWIAAGGGALGLIVAYLLASGTQKAWPLNTGGMPVVAMWPNIIIMFELTMLGAILATVVSLFITARLPTFESKLYDPEISNCNILVAVENPPEDSVDRLERTLLDVEPRTARITRIESM